MRSVSEAALQYGFFLAYASGYKKRVTPNGSSEGHEKRRLWGRRWRHTYAVGVLLQSPGSRSAPWVTIIQQSHYAVGVKQ